MAKQPFNNFSLQVTLNSGQVFRWRQDGEWWIGVLGKTVTRVRQKENELLIEGSASNFQGQIAKYFALDVDVEPILRSIDRDPFIHEAITRFQGLRIIRQEPWECIASFICASFNNIKRITGMIERLAVRFGEPLPKTGTFLFLPEVEAIKNRNVPVFSFPRPEQVAGASLASLRRCGLGYRAAYLRDSARMVAEGRLRFEAVRAMAYPEARQALLALPGVGEKVVECILLFAFQQYEAFPVDVWIKRLMERVYFRGRRTPDRRIRLFAQEYFGRPSGSLRTPSGRYAGWAQQYLYCLARAG